MGWLVGMGRFKAGGAGASKREVAQSIFAKGERICHIARALFDSERMFRKFPFLLVILFLVAFGSAAGLRAYWAKTGIFAEKAEVHETYTLAEKAPLGDGDVEILGKLNREYARISQAVVPAVVSLNTMGFRDAAARDQNGRLRLLFYPTSGQGSGVIISKQGHIVTNFHVIDQQRQVQVTLHNGKKYPAKLIGSDSRLDIAVLQILGLDQPVTLLPFGDSSKVNVGEIVFAVGNPFGLGETVTQGIISAKERSISDMQRDLFQTDAAINPGNSGGPLVNIHGEIIGINSSIYSKDKENPSFQGVSFSIPANDVKSTIEQILQKGAPVYGYLGVSVMPTMVPAGANGGHGVVLAQVAKGSPADVAGLRADDVLVNFNGKPVEGVSQLIRLIQRAPIGSQVTFDVWRNGKLLSFQATIRQGMTGQDPVSDMEDETPGASASKALGVALAQQIVNAAGIEVRSPNEKERREHLIPGVIVSRITPSSQARQHLSVNDHIIQINHHTITSPQQFYTELALSGTNIQTPLTLIPARDSLKQAKTVHLPLIILPSPNNR